MGYHESECIVCRDIHKRSGKKKYYIELRDRLKKIKNELKYIDHLLQHSTKYKPHNVVNKNIQFRNFLGYGVINCTKYILLLNKIDNKLKQLKEKWNFYDEYLCSYDDLASYTMNVCMLCIDVYSATIDYDNRYFNDRSVRKNECCVCQRNKLCMKLPLDYGCAKYIAVAILDNLREKENSKGNTYTDDELANSNEHFKSIYDSLQI